MSVLLTCDYCGASVPPDDMWPHEYGRACSRCHFSDGDELDEDES